MKREDKQAVIDSVVVLLNEYPHFYITDISDLNAEDTSNLRRESFKNDVKVMMVKNTLLKKALIQHGDQYEEIFEALKGTSAVMFSETGNAPAKLIKDFRKKKEKPSLKGAYVEESIYLGDDQLDMLSAIKSKDELLADIVALLQSPAKNVVSALQSGGSILHGILETLSEKE